MSLQSMTGFARSNGQIACGAASGKWSWELRSVNAKGLDIRLRLPPGFEAIENECRRAIANALSRGGVQASLQFDREAGASVPVVNQAALEVVLAALADLSRRLGSPPASAEAVLQIRGVLESGEAEALPAEIEARNDAVLAGLREAVSALAGARGEEGKAVGAVLSGQVQAIERLVEAIEADPSRSPAAIRERLARQLAPLLDQASGLDPQRLHQEAALLATKVDLREEIDRLNAHVGAAHALLAGAGPAGRKLDFLAQEFNRECNTICSKSNAASVTAAGLELKVLIDQFREQVQNIE